MTDSAYLSAASEVPSRGRLSFIFNRKVADVLTGAAVSATVSMAVKAGIFAAVGTAGMPLAVTAVGAAMAAGFASGAARHALAWRAARREGHDVPAFWSRENGRQALRKALLSGVFSGAGGGLFMALDHCYGDRIADIGGKAVSWLQEHFSVVSAAHAQTVPEGVVAIPEPQMSLPHDIPVSGMQDDIAEAVTEETAAVIDYTIAPVNAEPASFTLQTQEIVDFTLPPAALAHGQEAMAFAEPAPVIAPLQFVTYTDDLYALVTTEDMLKERVSEAIEGRNLSRAASRAIETAFGEAQTAQDALDKAQAIKDIAFNMLNGRGGMAEDAGLGVALMQMAAAAGNTQARVDMAYIAYHGLHGVTADPQGALASMRGLAGSSATARDFVSAWTGAAPSAGAGSVRAASGTLSCRWNMDSSGNLAGGVCKGPGANVLKVGDKVTVPVVRWR